MQSLSTQDLRQLGGPSSVLARQKRDHVKLDQLLNRLADVPPDWQDAVLIDIYRLVFPHAFAEEAVLWPVIRRVLPDGQELTVRVELEHQQINQLVTKLEALAPGSPDHQEVLGRMVELLREDVRDEEDELLPRLQARLTVQQLRLLGFVWEFVRAIAPTRAHPIVSRRPPGNVLSALPLALVDRCRDLVDKRAQAAVPRGTLLAGLSSVLTRASHTIERLPGMRSGEDRATRIPSRGSYSRAAVIIALGLGTAAVILQRQRTKLSEPAVAW